MRFKLTGIQTELKSQPIAQVAYNSNDKVYVAGFLAYKDSSKTNENLVNIAILSQNPLATGSEYGDPGKLVSNNTEVPEVILTYYNSQALYSD